MKTEMIDIHLKGRSGDKNHEYLQDRIRSRDRSTYPSAIDYVAAAVRLMEEKEHIINIRVSELSDSDYNLIMSILRKDTKPQIQYK